MRRGTEEVNGTGCALDIGDAARRARLAAVAIVLAAFVFGCGGEERRAERLYREAERLVEKGEPASAVERLEVILREYPDAQAAVKAREKMTLYRGLSEAIARYPQRRAREIVVAVARAIERARAARNGLPGALADLVPEFLESEPPDPWGGTLAYARVGPSSYRLASLGADGAVGGMGNDADIVVVDGKFVEDVAP